ncbi:hypothetical protein Hypma_002729 [Hypsizygus marmoreus]|uniref:Uncharacterized protein n=1 Tax=Hypsizygus marmoreus TaxID=39966 RepID=A0A369J3G0_HYPMA|nr:hypothetical protein Hypma_002729 [Hypsizygus marmoreus]
MKGNFSHRFTDSYTIARFATHGHVPLSEASVDRSAISIDPAVLHPKDSTAQRTFLILPRLSTAEDIVHVSQKVPQAVLLTVAVIVVVVVGAASILLAFISDRLEEIHDFYGGW